MIREAIKYLNNWKDGKHRKPLIIRGARQVGKTWIMKEFGKTRYEKLAYINFDNNERMESLFSGNFDISRIIIALQIESGVKIECNNTLIIFDEVQEVPRALTSLKYFCENAPQYHIIAAGSLLGVALHPGTSFPVGKVDFMDLYPLNFIEFLNATGNENLASLLQTKDFELITSFKGKYIDLLKQYYYIGGMPEVVSNFIETQDYTTVREVQKRLLMAYEQDFSKHAPNESVPRIRMLWASIPAQLAKENRKFVYGLVRQGARAKEFELSMQWLLDCGLIYKVSRITKPDMPLMAYQDFNAFKLYILDVGLLSAMSGLDIKSLLEGNSIFEEFKGALTEQFVLQQLITNKDITPFYWTAEKSNGEVDFVFQSGMNIIPLEVKAAENLQAKSLKSYCLRYNPKDAIRTSMSDYRKEEWLTNLPLYAINSILNVIASSKH
ncbi:ATP-binding protein [Clostridium sp.]|uniref:ATP-binding protein n=1 Tax=Clostridium sp. TaxID=1506 RepID=UPI001A50B031|nr:ATP-binding protein [Clostridium sp.]MBK5240766.1 ATP-binding protein [Clostridium sp.]